MTLKIFLILIAGSLLMSAIASAIFAPPLSTILGMVLGCLWGLTVAKYQNILK